MFIIAGEGLIDLFVQPDESLRPVAGGAPYNSARALALQGIAVGYANPISQDRFGQRLLRDLLASSAQHLGALSARPTSLALVSANTDGQSRYSFYRDGVADRDVNAATLQALLNGATVFHSGALALVPPDHEIILPVLARSAKLGVLRSIDVNMRPQVAASMGISLQAYRDAALAVIERADIVKVSDEDLQHLGCVGEPLTGARTLLQRGCRLVVLTLGAAGAWVLTDRDEIFRPAQSVTVADTVGAGDCFYAGFIASLWRANALQHFQTQLPLEQQLSEALEHGARCAAINVGRRGCQPPTWDEALTWRP